jgi:hypothetical protein
VGEGHRVKDEEKMTRSEGQEGSNVEERMRKEKDERKDM